MLIMCVSSNIFRHFYVYMNIRIMPAFISPLKKELSCAGAFPSLAYMYIGNAPAANYVYGMYWP